MKKIGLELYPKFCYVDLCLSYKSSVFTIHNEVAKVMFLQMCVCPQGGVGVSASVHAGIPTPLGADPPRADTPGADTPQSRHPSQVQTSLD